MKTIFKVVFFNLILSLAFFHSCKKSTLEIHNLNGDRITVIGHGGSGFYSANNPYWENSYPSILRALYAYHADGIEVDIQLSRDSVIILYHNDFLDESTNCSGCVQQHDAADLYPCTYKYSTSLEDEKIIDLNKITNLFKNSEVKPIIILDVKLSATCSDSTFSTQYQYIMARRIMDAAKNFGEQYFYIESHDTVFLNIFQQNNSQIHLILDGRIEDGIIAIAADKKYYGIGVSNPNITKEDVDKAHQKNVRVVLFEVKNFFSTKNAVGKNPDMIQTDNVLLLQKMLNQ